MNAHFVPLVPLAAKGSVRTADCLRKKHITAGLPEGVGTLIAFFFCFLLLLPGELGSKSSLDLCSQQPNHALVLVCTFNQTGSHQTWRLHLQLASVSAIVCFESTHWHMEFRTENPKTLPIISKKLHPTALFTVSPEAIRKSSLLKVTTWIFWSRCLILDIDLFCFGSCLIHIYCRHHLIENSGKVHSTTNHRTGAHDRLCPVETLLRWLVHHLTTTGRWNVAPNSLAIPANLWNLKHLCKMTLELASSWDPNGLPTTKL